MGATRDYDRQRPPGHDLRYAIDATKLRDELGWRPARSGLRAGPPGDDRLVPREPDWWTPQKRADRGQVRGPGALMPVPRAARSSASRSRSPVRRCPRLSRGARRSRGSSVPPSSIRSTGVRPVPGFGDPAARSCLGLAPAAHGGNRTGRIFTGDAPATGCSPRSGAPVANQPKSVSRDDGLRSADCWVTAAVRCAPPANRPTAGRARQLRRPGSRPARAAPRVRGGRLPGQVRLGCGDAGCRAPRPRRVRPRTRGRRSRPTLLGSYHVSQQNTFTGRLTEPMLDAVFARALRLGEEPAGGSG